MEYNVWDKVEFNFIDEDDMTVHGVWTLGAPVASYDGKFSVQDVAYFQDNEANYTSLNIDVEDIVGKIIN